MRFSTILWIKSLKLKSFENVLKFFKEWKAIKKYGHYPSFQKIYKSSKNEDLLVEVEIVLQMNCRLLLKIPQNFPLDTLSLLVKTPKMELLSKT